jgi:hypothetical protein
MGVSWKRDGPRKGRLVGWELSVEAETNYPDPSNGALDFPEKGTGCYVLTLVPTPALFLQST